jgi:hypothetical protein
MTTFAHTDKRKGEKVIADFRKLLETGDMKYLNEGVYHQLTMRHGFIAHYGLGGFRSHYEGRLGKLLDGEGMETLLKPAYYPALDEPRYSSGYADGLSAWEVKQAFGQIARECEDDVRYREAVKVRDDQIAVAQAIVDTYGVTLEPADKVEP